ncbi:hypothetical protein AB1N83_006639 [Pleurotus pulmonarius]
MPQNSLQSRRRERRFHPYRRHAKVARSFDGFNNAREAHIGYVEAVALVDGMTFVGLAGKNGRQRVYIVLMVITYD